MGQHRTPLRNCNLVKPHILHILNLSFSKGLYESFVSKAQILSKSFKPFWSLDSERGHSYLSSLNDERLSGIRYRTSTILGARKSIFGSKQWLQFRIFFIMTFYDKMLFYYKMCQVSYYKMRQ